MGKIKIIEGGDKIPIPFALAMENKIQGNRLLSSVVLCFLFVENSRFLGRYKCDFILKYVA